MVSVDSVVSQICHDIVCGLNWYRAIDCIMMAIVCVMHFHHDITSRVIIINTHDVLVCH